MQKKLGEFLLFAENRRSESQGLSHPRRGNPQMRCQPTTFHLLRGLELAPAVWAATGRYNCPAGCDETRRLESLSFGV